MQAEQRAAAFLRQQGMDPAGISMPEQVELFQAEMARGLHGQASSLAMFPSYITPPHGIPEGLPVLAIDAGGTHFRAARVIFRREQGPALDSYRQFPMPGTSGEVDSDLFFDRMAGYVSDLAAGCHKIGFCFSYPVEMLPERDGRLISLAKEVQVKGITGRMIGRELVKALARTGVSEKQEIVLLNDTVAALLAGTADGCQRPAARIGLILGTGSNTCYLEEGRKIEKIKDWPPEQLMVVNVESGAYALAPRGAIDREFDRGLRDPGSFPFEKMIAGRYLGPLLLAVLRAAAADGMFSDYCRVTLAEAAALPTTEINSLLAAVDRQDRSGIFSGVDHADRSLMAAFAASLVRRAALLTAVALAALALKTGGGRDPARPLTIAAEGSTFYRLWGLESGIRQKLDEFLTAERGLHYRITGRDHAVLVGSAVAALSEAPNLRPGN